jgi:hypothetical protein
MRTRSRSQVEPLHVETEESVEPESPSTPEKKLRPKLVAKKEPRKRPTAPRSQEPRKLEIDAKQVGTYSLRRTRKQVNYKESRIKESDGEEEGHENRPLYARQSCKPRTFGAVPRIMTGKAVINLKGTIQKAVHDDDIVFSSDQDAACDAIKISEIDEINKKFKSDSEEEVIDTSKQAKLDSESTKNCKKQGSEDEWKEGIVSEVSVESEVSLFSDPNGNRVPRGPKGPEQKSVRELIEQSKYRKLMRVSKESYRLLNEGIGDAGEGQEQKEDVQEKEGEGSTQDSELYAPVDMTDILPFVPPVYKCIRMPQHLKWVTIHHSTVSIFL